MHLIRSAASPVREQVFFKALRPTPEIIEGAVRPGHGGLTERRD